MARSNLATMCTRYLWLPPLGAALAVGLSLAVFAGASAANPRYVASVPFAVLPPAPVIGETAARPAPGPDDAIQIINRQAFIFRQDNFLKDVLLSSEFHPDDKPNHECAWLAAHKRDPLRALKRDLVLVPDIASASFEIRMTTSDPTEAYSLVQAAVKVYLQRLLLNSQVRKNVLLLDLANAIKERQSDFELKSADLVDYAKRNNVDALKTSYEIEKNSLIDLNRDYTLADAAARNAEDMFKIVDQRRQNKEEIPLPSDLLQSIENDSTLKTLINTRLTLQQDKAAASVPTPNSQRVAEIDARMATVDNQIADTRKTLTQDARERIVTLLHDEALSQRNLAQYVNEVRGKKEAIVTNIGQNFLVWDQRVAEVKEAGDIVAQLRRQLTLAQSNRATDDTRIAKIDDPLLPDKPAGPDWDAFWPLGLIAAAVGLLGGTLIAWFRARRPADTLAPRLQAG